MSFLGALFGAGRRRQEPQPLRLNLRTDAARDLIIGRAGTAGAFVFHGLSDSDGRNREGDNRFLHQVIAVAGHRCNRLTRVWGDGEIVRSTPLAHGQRTEIPAFRDGRRARLWLTWYDGRADQAADPFLTSQFILPERWRSSDRLRGIAYVIVTAQFDRDVLTSPPEFIFEVEGAPLYDRRRDSTAGGAGSQRWNAPTSWVYSDNPAVAADHYQLGMVGGANNDEIIFGMGLQSFQVPFDEFQANADVCDEQVPTASGGTQARYAANGILSAEAAHRDNISTLATSMAAQPFDTGGQVIIRPIQARPVVMTLTDRDLVSGADYELNPTPSGTDLVNFVRGTYREPANRFNEQDYPSVKDDDLVAEDGRPFEHTLDLDMEIDSERAQRIANIELARQSRRDRITETFMPVANRLKVGDWFERQTSFRGGGTKIYEVEDKRIERDLTVRIVARETDPSDVAFSVDQVVPVDLPQPFPPLVGARPVAPVAVMTPTEKEMGALATPSIAIDLSPFDDNSFNAVDFFEAEYGFSNGLAPPNLGINGQPLAIARFANEANTSFELLDLIPGATYAIRWRSISDELIGDWGPYTEFTTTAERTATGALAAVEGGQLAQNITAAAAAAGAAQSSAAAAIAEASSAAGGVATLANTRGQSGLIADPTFQQDLTTFANVAGGVWDTNVPEHVEIIDEGGGRFLRLSRSAGGATIVRSTARFPARKGDRFLCRVTLRLSPDFNAIGSNFRVELFELDGAGQNIVFPDLLSLATVSVAADGMFHTVEGVGEVTDDRTERFSLAIARNDVPGTVDVSHCQIWSVPDGFDNEVVNARVDTTVARLDARSAAAGGFLPNWNFAELDGEGRPAGIRAIESVSAANEVQLQAGGLGIVIAGQPDPNVAFGFPAIPINEHSTYSITIRHRSSEASAAGLFLRMNERSSALPDGVTHVTAGQRSSIRDLVGNGPMPGPATIEETFVYQPTPGTRFASFSMYNWTAFTGEYEVGFVQMTETSEELAAAATLFRDSFISPEGARARILLDAGIPGANAFGLFQAVDENGQEISDIVFGAERFTLLDTANPGEPVPALQIRGGVAAFSGAILAGGGVLIGPTDNPWPVALQARDYALLDGESVDFGFDFGAPALLRFNTSSLPSLPDGETYVITFSNNDGTGFTLSAKRTVPGTPVDRVGTVDSSGGPSFDRTMNQIHADAAFDGNYTFEITTDIRIDSASNPFGSGPLNGSVTVRFFVHDGAGFVEIGQALVQLSATGTSSSVGQTRSVESSHTFQYGGPLGASAGGAAFAVFADGHEIEVVTDLRRVSYTSMTSSPPIPATSGGQRVIVTAEPQNA